MEAGYKFFRSWCGRVAVVVVTRAVVDAWTYLRRIGGILNGVYMEEEELLGTAPSAQILGIGGTAAAAAEEGLGPRSEVRIEAVAAARW